MFLNPLHWGMASQAKDLRADVSALLNTTDTDRVLKSIEDAANSLLLGMGRENVCCRLTTWDDPLPAVSKRAVLFMVRAEVLYDADWKEEAQKCESLALAYASDSN
jgi:hypothetical protein